MFARLGSNVVLHGLVLAIVSLALCVVLFAPWDPAPTDARFRDGVGPAEEVEPNVQAEDQLCLEHTAAKDDLAQAVRAGQLTFLEAAARFRALDARRGPRFQRTLAAVFPGLTQDEATCRMVLSYLMADLQDRPAGDEALLSRLEAELAEHVHRGDLHEAMTRAAGSPDR